MENLIRLSNKPIGLPLLILSLLLNYATASAFDYKKLIGKGVQAARPLSEREEYYIGRAVAARLLSTYPLLENQRLTEYINYVGQAVAVHSNKPTTYGGYHFAILDTNEVNAFACPGGTIFITRGMLNAVQNEDELAAVLAHEVAHINHRDGISSIQKARLTEVGTFLGAQALESKGPRLSKLVDLFEGSIDDVFKTLVVNGYGRSQEFRADESALLYLSRTGYNPAALKDFLNRLVSRGAATSGGVMKTHPATTDRIKNVQQKMPSRKVDPALVQLRSQRFQMAKGF
jgi:predicted Zn-dependent protease